VSDPVKIGVQLPQGGPGANAPGILAAARAAEAAGISSVNVFDRLIVPRAAVEMGDGRKTQLDPRYRILFDPIETLTAVAVATERVELVTGVLDILFHPPVVLARQLATLDNFASGRLVLGVGQGWMREEFDLAGVPYRRRGAGFDEHVGAMRAVWAPDPVSFSGRFYSIPESDIEPKPIRRGGPPVLAGTSHPDVLRRVAQWADGLLPVIGEGATWDGLEAVLRTFHDAWPVGRPAPDVRLRAHTRITDQPLGHDRIPTSGSVDQVVEDLGRLATLGVTEVCLNQTIAGVPFDEQLDAATAVQRAITA
jgi:probable F420-dependent oxidoreductase